MGGDGGVMGRGGGEEGKAGWQPVLESCRIR